jgi:hypothetical protein
MRSRRWGQVWPGSSDGKTLAQHDRAEHRRRCLAVSCEIAWHRVVADIPIALMSSIMRRRSRWSMCYRRRP